MGLREVDPLLVKDRSTLMVSRASTTSSSTQSNGAREKYCGRWCRGRAATTTTTIVLVLAVLVGGVLFLALPHPSGAPTTVADETTTPTGGVDGHHHHQITFPLVERTSDGEYNVHYARNVTRTTTFAELAQTLLPPWHQASQLAMEEDITIDMDPSNVQNARKVLLTTRDLLDICSPVYPTKGLWKRIRTYYKTGYETLGDFQDLDHAKVVFSPELWAERRQAVLTWKADFQRYARKHNVTQFFHTVDPTGSYSHKESHLFWGKMAAGSLLPRGDDGATASLQQLAVVQLTNALDYLHEISNYTTVLEVAHQEEFHNLRKELRSVLDEYTLMGSILLPQTDETAHQLKHLHKTRHLLGKLNDHWTAYNIYVTRQVHPKKQKALASQINGEWDTFQQWSTSHDLEGTIQALLNQMKR